MTSCKTNHGVDIVRSLDMSMLNNLDKYDLSGILAGLQSQYDAILKNDETLEQVVHITAEFPNATDKNEIEEAFEDLINRATELAYQNTRK